MTLWQKFAGVMTSFVIASGIVLFAASPSLAQIAQAPVAVVEEVSGKIVGVEFMDYVAPGKVIKLGSKGSIVLAYMNSCWRETIKGGTVVIGADQSLVHLSEIERVRVPCDRDSRLLTVRQNEFAGSISRGLPLSSKVR